MHIYRSISNVISQRKHYIGRGFGWKPIFQRIICERQGPRGTEQVVHNLSLSLGDSTPSSKMVDGGGEKDPWEMLQVKLFSRPPPNSPWNYHAKRWKQFLAFVAVELFSGGICFRRNCGETRLFSENVKQQQSFLVSCVSGRKLKNWCNCPLSWKLNCAK